MVSDGRFRQVRKTWDECTERGRVDPGLLEDVMLMFEPYPEGDFRTLQRKLAFASNLRETQFLALPNVKRSALKATPRAGFNICGEESSHDLQYSGVAMRTLPEMPMLSVEDLGLQSWISLFC